MNRARRLLAGVAVSAAVLAPSVALGAGTPEYVYIGHDSEAPHGIISTIQFLKAIHAPKVVMNPYYSHCGEFWTGWLPVRSGGFSYEHQWSSGYGVQLSGRFNAAGTGVTGHVRTWGPGCSTPTLTFSAKKSAETVDY